MEFVIIFVIIAAIIIWFFISQGPTEKQKREQDIIRETAVLHKKASEIDAFSADAFIALVTENIKAPNLRNCAFKLFSQEGFNFPGAPPEDVLTIEAGRYRDELKNYIALYSDENRVPLFIGAILEYLKPFDTTPEEDGFFRASRDRTNKELQELALPFLRQELLFTPLRQQLMENFKEQNNVLPSKYNGDNCAWAYLKHTPLYNCSYEHIEVHWHNRDAHTLILGGSGSGKTTLVKHMIAKLLQEDCCVVVLDSQSQVIEELAQIELPDDDLTWISPEHKLALNPFDISKGEFEDETVINNKISLLEFVIENLIEAPMTPRWLALLRWSNCFVRVSRFV